MKKHRLTILFFLSLLSPISWSTTQTTHPPALTVLRMTPAGESVPIGNQIIIEFNQPVVPLGRMDRDNDQVPISTTPSLNCHWRWLNSSTLSCNLNEIDKLKPATQYTLTVNPGIKTEEGVTLTKAYQHVFVTERPDIEHAYITDWIAPGAPVLDVYTKQPTTRVSLQKHLVLTVSTDAKKNYDVIVQKKKREVMRNEDGSIEEGEISKPQDDNPEVGTAWEVVPKKELPLDSKVTLNLTPGLISTLGIEKSTTNKTVLSFDTFPAFKFLGLHCVNNAGKEIRITENNPQKPDELCNPQGGIDLNFNAPVLRSEIYRNVEFVPKLEKGDKAIWNLDEEKPLSKKYHEKDTVYSVRLPGIKAVQHYTVISRKKSAQNGLMALQEKIVGLFKEVPLTDITDAFGRKLQNPIALQFATDHRLPNFEMPYQNAVLEKETDSEVPLYVNNLDQIHFNYRAITPDRETPQQSVITQTIPKVEDIQFAIPLGIRQLFHGHSGALYGALSTEPAVKKSQESESVLFAQVTPYQLHVKLGHFNTLVWVTDLATGLPVADAQITIYQDRLKDLSATPRAPLASARTDTFGTAILPGIETLDPDLKVMHQWGSDKTRLFVRVDKEHEMALMPLAYDFAIDTWRATDTTSSSIYTDNKQKYGHLIAWGATAQGIYRVGDTLQYKFYVRNQNNQSLVTPPLSGYTLQILDPTGKVVDEKKDITLSAFGAYSGEFNIPKEAAVGWYVFNVMVNYTHTANKATHEENTNAIVLSPMRVLVSDFTPSAFKVSNEINGTLFKPKENIEVTTFAQLHSGGAYTDAQARITAILTKKTFTPDNPLTQGFIFDRTTEEKTHNEQVYQTIAQLNDKGELKTQFSIPKQNIVYGQLSVESAVQDDRGKYIAAKTQADYVGLNRFVGLKTTQWVYNAQKPAKIQYIVVDEKGHVVTGTPVDIQIEYQVTDAARVKDAGNAYVTHYTNTWKVESTCQGVSQAEPSTCEFTPTQTGLYRVTATIKDTQGNIASAQTPLWVIGKNYVLWDEASDTYLPILPEKKTYKIDDKARFLIKNPYPGAKALITVERYGVIDRFVQTLDSSSPIIEFPIKPDYLPGFYLSVLVVSPRVEKPLENGQVDLGKPTFRMGYIAVPVEDTYKKLSITAKTDQLQYRPRDKVTLQLHVEKKLSEPVELAVAVLDESVFDLLAGGLNDYDPYKGFYHLDALDIQNYSLLTRLVGRQKFEKKGANPGGDGGIDLGTRDVFKFVSYWNPSIIPDANGNATLTFDAPDNLTAWRVLAMGVTPTDHLGLASVDFKVNRPTEIRPVMPNQVMEGDHFKAGFSVMNRTDKTRTLKVEMEAEGAINTQQTENKHQETITLAPYKRTTVWMPIHVSSSDQKVIQFVVKAGDAIDTDRMTDTITVKKIRSLETVATYGTTIQDHVLVPIAIPDQIYTDVGSINVITSPSVIANITGAFRYMRDYPYDCWEQKLTKGVMAAHYLALKKYLPTQFVWKESTDLPQQTLALAANAQAPNGGMTFYKAEDQYADPYLSAYTALAFNTLRQAGYVIPLPVERKLQDYLLNFLRRDTAPHDYNESMKATVRAVALEALAEQGKITKDDLQRYLPFVKQMSLFGQAYFVQAAMQVKGAENTVTEVTNTLLSHANQSAGQFIFSETLDDAYQRILTSPLRDNCAVLSTLIRVAKTANQADIKDIPFKLMSTITQTRKNRDHWENTQENIFCMQALVDYSRAYENTTPKMTVGVDFKNRPLGETQFNSLRDLPITFSAPMKKEDAGHKDSIVISRQGEGRLYYTTQINFAPLEQKDAINAGMDIQREYSVQREGKWVLLKDPLKIHKGELIRVDIYLALPAARNFVVVDDAVPGGLEPVNRDLATTSTLDALPEQFTAPEGSVWFTAKDWIEYNVSRWSFYHQELRHDVVRYYSDYLPAGHYHLSYTAQAIASGDFSVPAVKAEEMYNPDVFGKGVFDHLWVD